MGCCSREGSGEVDSLSGYPLAPWHYHPQRNLDTTSPSHRLLHLAACIPIPRPSVPPKLHSCPHLISRCFVLPRQEPPN